MRYFDVTAHKEFSLQKMKKVNLFDTEHLFCDLYCLKLGQFQKPHTHHGADKIYYVLEGRGTFLIGDEEQVLQPGQIVLAPSGIVHGVRNDYPDNLSVLVLMAPNPNRTVDH